MRPTATVQGRSLVFNVVFVLLNVVGLAFVVMANHPSFSEVSLLFNLIGGAVMLFSIFGIILFKGRMMMSGLSRILVGGTFIVSGLVKANDPVGFSYKLEDYFEDGALAYRIKELFGAPAFSLEFLTSSALSIAVIICIAEIVLGVLTIVGTKIKPVAYALLGMMLFFTFLTWHTADCNPQAKFTDRDTYAMSSPIAKQKLALAKEKKVTIVSQTSEELVVDEVKSTQCVNDCGCFGDALKGSVGRSLYPIESFWKDLVLLYLVVWIFLAQWSFRPNTAKQNIVFGLTTLVVVAFFSWVFGWYFPLFFAPLAILGALWVKRVGGRLLGNQWGSALAVTLFSSLLVAFVLHYDPIKDFRPYAVGSHLRWKMNDGVPGVIESELHYRNKRTGEKQTYISGSTEYNNSKIWEDDNWVNTNMVDKVIRPAIPPSISNFRPQIPYDELSEAELGLPFVKELLTTTKVKRIRLFALEEKMNEDVLLADFSLDLYPPDDYQIVDTIEVEERAMTDVDITDALLDEKRVVILVSRNLKEADWDEIDRIKAIAESCKQKKVPFVMITNAARSDMNAFRKKHQFDCAIFSMDEIELKIISRSNPAVLVLEKGVVKGKYSHNGIPNAAKFAEYHLKK